jgi:SAM-dependent methyltransferase
MAQFSANTQVKQQVKSVVHLAKSWIKGECAQNRVRDVSLANTEESIPLAGVVETQLESFEARDWRTHFSNQLSGKGLEIGPLHRPMVRHDGMDIDYIDRCTVAELREHYPELKDLPLVEPDIIGDAESLEGVPDQSYDFLISAHVIEHMKNPLGSLQQWCRVVKPGGKLYLIVPDKRATFDKKRVRTAFPHIIKDFQNPSAERDFEHYLDYAIHVHDKSEDAAIEEANRLIETDYSIHFHVFIPSDIIALLSWFSKNVHPVSIIEGPSMSPGSDEFHFLLEVGQAS